METKKLLKTISQEQLIPRYESWGAAERARFDHQISSVDWSVLESMNASAAERGEISPIDGVSVNEMEAKRETFEAIGRAAVAEGKVAAVLLAGGQGTRLGSSAPKGAFNIGVTRPLYIFEQLIENLKEVCAKCKAFVPLFIMTSEKNDKDTRTFFEEHAYFGYPKEYVRFFVQEMAPCVDFEGKVLLEEKGCLALSPNGNGGWYRSLERAGLLKDKLLKRAEWFNVFSVDNVLQRIADPAFVGATISSGRKSGAKVVRKARPEEKVGVLCLENGLPSVIEYYELSGELANLKTETGELVYRFGVTLNYLFHAKTLREISAKQIPVHLVKKKIPYFSAEGVFVQPLVENGYKFETLILDMVRLMGSCLPCEVEREKEFAPVKNQTGVDSVETARALLEKNGVKL